MAANQKQKQHTLTAVDYDICRFVHEYHFLTVSQVTRLRYSAGSETTCQDRLKRLFDAPFHVLDRIRLPYVGTGNTEYLYTLSTKGQKELQEIGIASFSRYRHPETHSLKLPHLQHLISLNDFLIAARLLSRAHSDITLSSMKHDLDMKRAPLRVYLEGQTVSLVPDGFLDFRLSIAGRLYAVPVWVELDRGTEWGKTLQKKLRSIIAAVHTQAYEEIFGVASITVAIATTEGIKRRELMLSFIKDELLSRGLPHLENFFLCTNLPEKIDPLHLFLSPVWYPPDTRTPLPLLDFSEE